MPHRAFSQRGQASVELVAILPLLGVLAVLAWQSVVAGQAVWLAGTAARAAARAHGLGRDPIPAARAALPPGYRAGLRVTSLADGRVAVRVRIRAVAGVGLGTVGRAARFTPQVGR